MGVTNMSKRDKFIGMLITLRKCRSGIIQNSDEKHRYRMFGYYDSMDIYCTNLWHQSRLEEVCKKKNNVIEKSDFLDQGVLELYMPEPKVRKCLLKKGFAYDLWEEIGYRDSNDSYIELLKRYPFVSIFGINLSKQYVDKKINILSKITQIIQKMEREGYVCLQEIHCAVMLSMGYEDLVLLFFSDNPQKVVIVLDILRKAQDYEEDESYPMISNSYIITGFFRGGVRSLTMFPIVNTKLSISVKLHKGITKNCFHKHFKSTLKAICDIENIDKLEEQIDACQVFGDTDCLILYDIPFTPFILLLDDSKNLSLRDCMFSRHIENVYSFIGLEIGEIKLLEISNSSLETRNRICQIQVEDLTQEFKVAIKKCNKSMNFIEDIQIIIKEISNIVYKSCCFYTKEIIHKGFDVLKGNVERAVKIFESENKSDTKDLMIEGMFSEVIIFCEEIVDYLATLQRYGHFFVTNDIMLNVFSNYSVRLLQFYNWYINQVAWEVANIEDGKKNTYTFMVIMGQNEVMRVYDISSYMDIIDEEGQKLIIIKIPERGLYAIKNTIFQILHKFLYFYGEYSKKERFGTLVRSFSSYSAGRMSLWLERSLIQYGFVSIVNRLSQNRKKEVTKRGLEIVRECIENMEDKIKIEMQKRLQESSKEWEGFMFCGDFLCSTLEKLVKEKLFLSVERETGNSFFSYVYRSYMECQNIIGKRMSEYLRGQGIYFSNFNILMETSNYKSLLLEKRQYDLGEERVILSFFEHYIGNHIIFPEVISIAAEDEVSLNDALEVLVNAVRESYADCVAAKISHIAMEDFILSFIYEIDAIEQAFPKTKIQIFSFGSVLKIVYGIEKKLRKCDHKKIEERMQHWKEEGYEYYEIKRYTKVLCDRIDDILWAYAYEFDKGCKLEIENYLKVCLREFCADQFSEIRKINDLSDMDSFPKIYDLLNKICE